MWQPGASRLRTGIGATLRMHAHQHRPNSEGTSSWVWDTGKSPPKRLGIATAMHWQVARLGWGTGQGRVCVTREVPRTS